MRWALRAGFLREAAQAELRRLLFALSAETRMTVAAHEVLRQAVLLCAETDGYVATASALDSYAEELRAEVRGPPIMRPRSPSAPSGGDAA